VGGRIPRLVDPGILETEFSPHVNDPGATLQKGRNPEERILAFPGGKYQVGDRGDIARRNGLDGGQIAFAPQGGKDLAKGPAPGMFGDQDGKPALRMA
jgi:hypothetical protein